MLAWQDQAGPSTSFSVLTPSEDDVITATTAIEVSMSIGSTSRNLWACFGGQGFTFATGSCAHG